MIKIKGRFSSLNLSHKLTVLIITIIVLPMITLSIFFFENIRNSEIEEKKKSAEVNFAQNYSQIQRNIEVCLMSTQVVINSENFWDKLDRFVAESNINTSELIQFNQNDITGFEKLVNSNPYLYQIRVYIDSHKVPEMMPILYHKERLERLSWAKDDTYETNSWQFNYTDTIFPSDRHPTKHLAAYVTRMSGLENFNATIEISTRMELLFPDLFSSTDQEWTCFIDRDEHYYYNTKYDSRWISHINDLYNKKPEGLDTIYSEEKLIDNHPVIVIYKRVNELDGYIIKIVSLEEDLAAIKRTSNIFWSCFVVIVLLLIILTDKIVAIILKQFYLIMQTIRQVQKGNLGVRIPECGTDEMGELGQQINKMLDRITQLMDDNIKREVLVKDSEIRALQNQINAHFIYNVLESVKMMAEVDEKYDISDAVTSLGKLLRYSMKWVSKNVTVREEIDYIKNYLALINLRFDYEIYLSLNIPEEIYSQEIPKMSLQPIIENAIYHGIEEMAEDTSIYMKGLIYGDYCTIEITDAGKGMTEEQVEALNKKIQGEIETAGSSGNGIGLKNVQDRIKISFGNDYGISVASKKDCYTKVIVKIPFVVNKGGHHEENSNL